MFGRLVLISIVVKRPLLGDRATELSVFLPKGTKTGKLVHRIAEFIIDHRPSTHWQIRCAQGSSRTGRGAVSKVVQIDDNI
jgi:hypothetical protein